MHEGRLSDTPTQACDSRSSLLVLLQHHVQELDRSHSDDWLKWPDLTVNIFYALSETLGGVGLARHEPVKSVPLSAFIRYSHLLK
jgi:hypothetical protein